MLRPSLKQYSFDSLYTTYNNREGEGYQLETNEPAVIPPEPLRCFEQQTSVRGWCGAGKKAANFPRQFKTSPRASWDNLQGVSRNKNERKKKDLGWDKVHEHISKLPFCQYREQIVPMIICLEYPDCYFEDCCFPCFEREGTVHKVSLSPPIELIPLIEAIPEYKKFLVVCSWDGYDWHEWYCFSEKSCSFLVKNLIRLKHSRNDLACNIASIFLPLRCEIFIHKKHNQVEAGNHVFIICR